MSYAKSNPLFEFDIYRSQIDNSWNFFLSIFRWSFAIQLSKPQLLIYDDYLGGNYSSQQKAASFEEEVEAWYEKDSVEGEEHDDHEYHELEGIYYSHRSNQFIEVTQFNEDPLFNLEYEVGYFNGSFKNETVRDFALKADIQDGTWEKVMSP